MENIEKRIKDVREHVLDSFYRRFMVEFQFEWERHPFELILTINTVDWRIEYWFVTESLLEELVPYLKKKLPYKISKKGKWELVVDMTPTMEELKI